MTIKQALIIISAMRWLHRKKMSTASLWRYMQTPFHSNNIFHVNHRYICSNICGISSR